ncbi:alpha/beta hydrolase [bacterium]|nr:MAG: alpha/beta hydrolase [bacterium]
MTLAPKLLSTLALLAAGMAVHAAPIQTPAPAPARHFDVKVVGHGKPVLLIPGLTCNGNVWDATVARLKTRYECHVLTLPGFGGQPVMAGPFLEPIRDEIVAYVRERHLDHPAIIGHSLGGFLGFSLESKAPDLFGPLVAVDGVPWLMALFDPKATIEGTRPSVEAMRKAMIAGNATPDGFRNGTRASLASQIKSPKEAEAILKDSARSDPATVMNAMSEMMLTDLRPSNARITAPVLLLAAGDWAKTPEQRTMLTRAYEAQVAGVKTARVVPFWEARHFIMFDAPERFYGEVEDFLAKSWPKR